MQNDIGEIQTPALTTVPVNKHLRNFQVKVSHIANKYSVNRAQFRVEFLVGWG